jgi:hypothetical protein
MWSRSRSVAKACDELEAALLLPPDPDPDDELELTPELVAAS